MLCAQHQKTIVDDILTLSKLDASLVVLAPDICQVPPILQKALKIFDSQLKSAHIESSIQIHNSFLNLGVDYVMLDSGRVLQIIINLLGNAVKFVSHSPIRRIVLALAASKTAPKGEQSGTAFLVPRKRSRTASNASLDLPLRDDDQEIFIQFSVEDTGPGMTEDEISNLFHRFAQASPKTYNKYGGSGLGLYISRQLTELHGGQIGLRSNPGLGSTFSFYIKAKRAAPPRSETEQDSANILALMNRVHLNEEKSTKELHILLVEDNKINQRVVAQQLKRAGCPQVHTADHGVEALSFLVTQKSSSGNSTPPSLILLDVEMPVMDGLTAARRIREMEKTGELTQHIPIIAITANARKEQITAALEAGMDEVVTKPFRIADLVPRIEAMVNRWSPAT
ncbi:CheY-like superfamily [Delphinella strobiligena]|nr:CheY-like superfamily [Delphinella strobiligena]